MPQPDLLDKDEAEEEIEDSRPGRKLDKELRVMGAMLRMLDELDSAAQSRAVAWLTSRFREDNP